MSSSAPGKKRKRQAEDNTEAARRQFSASTDLRVPGSHPTPILALRSAISLPNDTPFTAYVSEMDKNEIRLHAEDGKMEWDSQAEMTGLAGFSYFIGVHRKSTGQVSLVPAPPHIMMPTVKSYRRLPERGANEELLDNRELRSILGTTFGTKVAQRRIAAAKRNRVDPTSQDMVAQIDAIVKSVSESNVNYPTAEEQQKMHDDSRPLPPFDRTAERTKDIYDAEAVAPPIELEALNIDAYFTQKSDMERIKLLAHQKSKFVKERLFRAVADVPDPAQMTHKQRRRLQWIVYLSVLMRFRVHKTRGGNGPRTRLDGKDLPPVVVTSVADRFSEKLRGGAAFVSDRSEKLLLHYILVLCLMIDKFSLDISVVADDLDMSAKAIEIALRGLGCKIATPTQQEYDKLVAQAKVQGVSISASRKGKRAVLTCPLVFPAPPKIKARKH